MDEINNQFPLISPPSLPEAPMIPAKAPKPALKIILSVFIGIAILAGVFTAVLATRFFDPLWNPFRPSPDQVIALAFAKMDDVKIMHNDAKIVIDIKLPSEKAKISLNIKSDEDGSDADNPKSQVDADISLDAEGTGNVSLGYSMKAIGEEAYFNLTKVEAPSLTPLLAMFFGVDLNEFQNQWIEIDKDSLSALAGQNGPDLSAEQKNLENNMAQALSGKKFYSVANEMADERINDKEAYHLVISLDNKVISSALKDIIKPLLEEQISSSGITQLAGSNLDPALIFAAANGFIDEFFNNIGELNFDLWVGKKDSLIYKTTFSKTIDVAKLMKGFSEEIPPAGSLILSVNAEINSAFDNPVQIKAPEQSRPVSEALAGPIMIFQQWKNDAAISDNLLQIQSAADSVYLSNKSYYSLACKNATIKPSCEEIKKIAGVYPTIRVSKTKYCAFSKLSTPGNYFCVDNRGYYEADGVSPGAKGYCAGATFVCPAPVFPAGGIE